MKNKKTIKRMKAVVVGSHWRKPDEYWEDSLVYMFGKYIHSRNQILFSRTDIFGSKKQKK